MPRDRSIAVAKTPELPGQYVRDTALIPNNVSVSEAARVLGVGRPALSNFLNGNAAVSPDMAARIERAFGIPAQKLLDMQAAYDAALAKAKGVSASAKTYVPPFLGIKANEIENWAGSNISSRTRFPVFLRTLVNSTGIGLSELDFPGNDDAERPGWDGFAVASEGTPWIPEGRSGWEFGTNQDAKAKADSDYANRTRATDLAVRDDTTFVFVTPRRWPGKKRWKEDRRSEQNWKDVRVYDASDLEQWLEQSIAAQAWFAGETHRPSAGVHSLDKCWADWASVSDPPLVGSLFETAIRLSKDFIAARLTTPPEEPTIIAADSIEEALAFLAQLFGDAGGELAGYRDRVIVFREPGVLPKLAAGSSNFIAVATTREVERELASFSRSIHSIIVYPRNAANIEPHVVLEPLNHEAFRVSLEQMQFTRDDIDRLGHESGRSPTVLRRRLSNVPAVRAPEWAANHETASKLLPFLFAGAWNSVNQSDQIILSLLAGNADYESLEKNLQALARLNDTPVWSVGTFRGVISKIDLLFAIAGSVTELKTYFDIARLVLSEDDPALDLPEEKQWAANVYGKTREISGALRRGISETLVLLAVHGNTLFQSRLGIDVEAAAARLVRELLTPLTTRALEAHDGDLPTYAEVAPEEFLAVLEDDLKRDVPASFGLMRPVNSDYFGRCVRTGLLWALENLAWSPATLERTVLILARLAQIPIEDNWANKPIESLRAIYRSWMPQTAASLEKRIAVLGRVAKQYPDIAWKICVDQFGESHRVGHYSHKPRWRNDGHGYGEPIRDRREVYEFERKMVEMALNWKAHDKTTLCDLITRIYGLSPVHQTAVWKLVTSWASTASDSDKAGVREKIRVTVMSRRGVNRNKKLRAGKLVAAAKAAREALEPTDLFNKHEWLFRQSWVEESADEIEDMDFRKRDERITGLRTEALQAILSARGIQGILEFAELGQAAVQIGWLMATILPRDQVAEFILRAMPPDTDSWTRKNLVFGVLRGLQDDVARADALRAVGSTLSQNDFAKILRFSPFHAPTWALVDELDKAAQIVYWEAVTPEWAHQSDDDLNTGVDRLLEAKRPRAAFHYVHFTLEKLRPAVLFRLMGEIATGTNEPSGQYRLDAYHIVEAFKLLDASGEFSSEQLAGLEFAYIDALSRSFGAHDVRGVPHLERYVESHPEFFAEAVAWVYRRSDGREDPESVRSDDPERGKNRAERGYRFLQALRRLPGRNKLDQIEDERLLAWVNAVRQACLELGRQTVGDISLGHLFAYAPDGADGIWPCEAVRNVLEEVQSRDISRGMTVGRYNARGANWRGEGGRAERKLAEQYRLWATTLELSHPFVATTVLRQMANMYDREAEDWDTDAKIERRLM